MCIVTPDPTLLATLVVALPDEVGFAFVTDKANVLKTRPESGSLTSTFKFIRSAAVFVNLKPPAKDNAPELLFIANLAA